MKRAFEGEAWHGPSVLEIIEGITAQQDDLRAAIAGLNDSRLDQAIIEGMSSVYVTLHGIVQHDLYHAGQIAMLKKVSGEGVRNERTSK